MSRPNRRLLALLPHEWNYRDSALEGAGHRGLNKDCSYLALTSGVGGGLGRA